MKISDLMIDHITFRSEMPEGIVPAGHDPRIDASLDVTGQGIADDHHFAFIRDLQLFKHLIEEGKSRFFDAQCFRKKDAVHQFGKT